MAVWLQHVLETCPLIGGQHTEVLNNWTVYLAGHAPTAMDVQAEKVVKSVSVKCTTCYWQVCHVIPHVGLHVLCHAHVLSHVPTC